ncbi:primosomal protein N' [Undibacterium cyanobacteriorum]|uniref:Replication restart protein PriA n=1 Tax=Undibacterium cyanobacteriorum TaxID=3073561 RepID=A0ABY9RH99_9BURK|nr:primosomal protein N' [Undibacterium sp. 20NA77.5]WMW80601.1 primosomal protein N' [Undibacterium sp. 20NA77.5]
MERIYLTIALDTPLDRLFDYGWQVDGVRPLPGQIAIVPFGRQELAGVIVAVSDTTQVAADKLKDALAIRHQCPPLSQAWMDLCGFAADYYQRPLGEVMVPALPKNLRALKPVSLDRNLKKLAKAPLQSNAEVDAKASALSPSAKDLNREQQAAVDAISGNGAANSKVIGTGAGANPTTGFAPYLLHGVTGSGKTEVYLQATARILERDAQSQVLILVPEINLTPQLEAHFRARFAGIQIATLHSGMAEGERLLHWLAAHTGAARIILGTRLAILSSLPHLQLIVIDEEHDPSYKQQEGLRYSARDLAVWRAHQLGIPVVLGSATPSLETWQHSKAGRYRKLELRERAVKDAVLPIVKIINTEREKPSEGLTQRLISAVRLRLEKGEQSLLFLNRRGYAPVLHCDACGWISNCTRCTAHMVMHKPDKRLRCHHCGLETRIPRHCPTCGNIDLQALGRGTQRLEEALHGIFPEARVFRIDADSTKLKGSAEAAFDTVHRGEVDILIGTQMVAKGHDFKNLTLVAALNPDSALFSQDFRASERLFAQLMQVAGRAGRAGQKEGGNASEVLIQTRYPDHPLYHALMAHNYHRFADDLLEERQQAAMPPFIYQALLRAEARDLETAIGFLQEAARCLEFPGITINDPIPMTMTRVHNMDRAQLLIESNSRPALQAFLKEWISMLRSWKTRVKWGVEIDPVDI